MAHRAPDWPQNALTHGATGAQARAVVPSFPLGPRNMKTFRRPILCIAALLLTAVAGRALEIRLAPGRATHGFAFSQEIQGSVTGGSPGVLVGTAVTDGWLQISFGWDPNIPFVLLDLDAGEYVWFDPQGQSSLDLRAATFSAVGSSNTSQFFLVPAERASHPFVLMQAGSFTIASRVNSTPLRVGDEYTGADYSELRAAVWSSAMDFSWSVSRIASARPRVAHGWQRKCGSLTPGRWRWFR